jgi:hypothetical protein
MRMTFCDIATGCFVTLAATLAAYSSPDPAREMIDALTAPGPHPSLGDRAALFGRFVGTWDADYANYADDGSVTRVAGQVIFGWIIDGRAVQDVWIWYPNGPEQERAIGTTVRFFDTKSDKWRVIWISPGESRLVLMEGGAVGDRIVLMGQDPDGSSLRWSFNDIRPASFVWRGEKSSDEGRTWRLTGEYYMRRHPIQ